MKSLAKFVLSFLLIVSFILTPLSNQYIQAFSFGDLFDGDTYGDLLGEGDAKAYATTDQKYQQCLAAERAKPQANSYMVDGETVSRQTFEDDWCKKVAGISEMDEDDGGAPSETFLWKPVSDSDGKAVTLLPSSLRGTVIKTDLLDAANLKLETGRFSGDEDNGMRPHYRFTKPGSSYGNGIQVVAVVPEGAWIWKIPNGGSRFESSKGRFVTNAEMAAWDAMHAANAFNQSLQAVTQLNNSSSCPAGQTDTNTDKSLKVMAMGDSNTKGTEYSSFLAYRKAFKENMNAKGYSVDMVGSQSAGTNLSDNQHEGYPGEGIIRLQSIANGNTLTTYNPDVILLLIGSNDMWVSLDARTPVTDAVANSKVTALGTLLDTIHTKLPNTKIIVAKPGTPAQGETAATRPLGIYKNGITTLASSRSYVSVVDFTGFSNDGIHYDSFGYNSIASAFANKVDEITRRCTRASTTATSTPSTATTTPATTTELDVECKVSDTTPAVDEEIDIWLEVSGGTTPYEGKWSGDYKKADNFDKDVAEQTVSFDKKGNYKIKVTVTDGEDETAKDTCPTIRVTNDGVEDEVIVRIDETTNVGNNTTPATPSIYPYYRDLTVGTTGQDVSALQQYLVARGYLDMPAGVAYGYFGEATRAAVARWQVAIGISPAAGYFGARSRAAMGGYAAQVSVPIVAPVVTTPHSTSINDYYQSINAPIAQSSCVNITSPIYFGEQSQNVTAVQQFLVKGGYLVMPEGSSYGYYGKSTVTALSKFMTVRGFNHEGAIMDMKLLAEIKTVSCN